MPYNKKPKTINPNEVDPSVYYYDEVYDDMKEESKNDETILEYDRTKSKGSLYIKGLQETAELRRTEKELRKFKKYATDNETSTTSDEVVYVTEGYKRKLKEIKVLEEEKRRRLDTEKGNTMNFMKVYKCDNLDKIAGTIECDNPEPSTSCGGDNETIKDEDKDDSKEVIGPQQPTQFRKQLKTIKERKEFLRKVLAKRTVGKVLEDAIRRYKERKALATT